MEEIHLQSIHDQIEGNGLESHLITKQGLFPDGFDFEENSLGAIYASHIFEYLNGDEVDRGLANCYRWLRPGGKLFLLCYTIFIHELVNSKFQDEYERRLKEKIKWPGYLENFDKYSYLPDETAETEDEDSPFPSALHMYDLPTLTKALDD